MFYTRALRFSLCKYLFIHLATPFECTNKMSTCVVYNLGYQSVQFGGLRLLLSLSTRVISQMNARIMHNQMSADKTFCPLPGSLRRILHRNRPLRVVDDTTVRNGKKYIWLNQDCMFNYKLIYISECDSFKQLYVAQTHSIIVNDANYSMYTLYKHVHRCEM